MIPVLINKGTDGAAATRRDRLGKVIRGFARSSLTPRLLLFGRYATNTATVTVFSEVDMIRRCEIKMTDGIAEELPGETPGKAGGTPTLPRTLRSPKQTVILERFN